MSAIGEWRQGMRDTPPAMDRPTAEEEIAEALAYMPATPAKFSVGRIRQFAELILKREGEHHRYLADREVEDNEILGWMFAVDLLQPYPARFYSKFYFQTVVWAMKTLGHFDEPTLPLT